MNAHGCTDSATACRRVPRRPARWRPVLASLAGSVLFGCSVADNLSFGEIIEELDAIVKIDGTGADLRIAYVENAEITEWYMRSFLFVPMRGALAWAFGRRRLQNLQNPALHVRELLRELPDETGGELLPCSSAASRFAWLAQLDRSPETRVIALDGLAAMSEQLDLEPFAGAFEQMMLPADPQQLNVARTGIAACRPEARAGAEWPTASLLPYRDALAALTQQPLDSWADRLRLIQDLGTLYAAEYDWRARPWTALALRNALRHGIVGILLDAVQGRDERLADVRLCAMEQVRRLGGPRTVPLLLAVMAASPAQIARGESRFPDPFVQLRLIHYCGQLPAPDARTVVRLPGRADWEAMSPADFLATTVLNEQDYYSKLRVPALVALSWCLGRPRIDPDPEWVRDWREHRGP